MQRLLIHARTMIVLRKALVFGKALQKNGIRRAARWLLFAPALATAVCHAVPASAADASANGDKSFDEWTAIAVAQPVSPASAEAGDLVRQWTGPDGRPIKLVVKLPRVRANAAAVQVAPVPPGEDARPYFDDALARVRAQSAGKLVIPPGNYTFKTLGANGRGHWVLANLSDLDVEGAGATLWFTQNQPGLVITQSKRLRIHGLAFDYTLLTSSVGTIANRGGENVLAIDPKYPVGAWDAVYYLSEYDAQRAQWVQGGQRVILPPGSPTPAVYAGNQTYTSAAFKNIKAGKTVVVFHHWYGGQALKIDDSPGPGQAEDIVIDGVSVRSAPGMGILAYGLKRGLAILNSTVAPRGDGSRPVSSEYDAIHMQYAGGDILIEGNRLSGQGDDGINLNNPMHPIVSIAADGRSLVLSTYSRFISAGDSLAFFDDSGAYLGQARVTDKPKALGGLNNQVSLDRPIPGLTDRSVARDIALIGSRFVVANNTVEACNCHGLLVQLPNGLVEGNTFRNLNYNAVRLLTNVGPWKEGVGAFNVAVRRNTISGTGIDSSLPLPWAAISAYGGGRGNQVSKSPVNRYLDISDNTISDTRQGCVTIASSRDVKVSGNTCDSTNRQNPDRQSLAVLQSSGVNLARNRRAGATAPGVWVDPASTSAVGADGAF